MHPGRLYLNVPGYLGEGGDCHPQGGRPRPADGYRNGRYQREDHTFNSAFYICSTTWNGDWITPKEHTSLPEAPDLAGLRRFRWEVNERVVRDEILDSSGARHILQIAQRCRLCEAYLVAAVFVICSGESTPRLDICTSARPEDTESCFSGHELSRLAETWHHHVLGGR